MLSLVWIRPVLVHVQAGRPKRLYCNGGRKEVSRCTRSESDESILCKQQNMQVFDPSWFWNPEKMSLVRSSKEVHQWPHKQDFWPLNIRKIQNASLQWSLLALSTVARHMNGLSLAQLSGAQHICWFGSAWTQSPRPAILTVRSLHHDQNCT